MPRRAPTGPLRPVSARPRRPDASQRRSAIHPSPPVQISSSRTRQNSSQNELSITASHKTFVTVCINQDFRQISMRQLNQRVTFSVSYGRSSPRKRLIGYARASTYGQTLDSRLGAGCTSRTLYREKVTGARPDRREILKMLDRFAPGDVVTVTRIDRLARSSMTSTATSWPPAPLILRN
jgi:hypothetical protein